MPYRAELKRPDLKGQFPCSVCGKIFCHSSSLSRHRMQAHFKSYTCTQCNQEIASNETLRSHMFRMHSISRMFMCRCCNWAFPDKTSLHIHMQSMLRSGTPGDVAVLARSTTDDGPHDGMVGTSFDSVNTGKASSPAKMNDKMGSIFPSLMKGDNLLQYLRKDGVLGGLEPKTMPTTNQWLTAWLANNPFAPNLGSLGAGQTSVIRHAMTSNNNNKESTEECMEDEDLDELEIETTEEDLHEEEAHTPRSTTANSECDDCPKGNVSETKVKEEELNVTVDEKEATTEQPSPTVSDSHTSGTSSHHGDSPIKCYDCQIAKNRLSMSESKLREYEHKILVLEATIADLKEAKTRKEPVVPKPTVPAPAHMPMFPMPAPLPLMQNPAMKMLFQNLMQATLNRQTC